MDLLVSFWCTASLGLCSGCVLYDTSSKMIRKSQDKQTNNLVCTDDGFIHKLVHCFLRSLIATGRHPQTFSVDLLWTLYLSFRPSIATGLLCYQIRVLFDGVSRKVLTA